MTGLSRPAVLSVRWDEAESSATLHGCHVPYLEMRSGRVLGAGRGRYPIRSDVVSVSRSTQRWLDAASAESELNIPANNVQSAMEPGAIMVFPPSLLTVNSLVSTVRSAP